MLSYFNMQRRKGDLDLVFDFLVLAASTRKLDLLVWLQQELSESTSYKGMQEARLTLLRTECVWNLIDGWRPHLFRYIDISWYWQVVRTR